MQTLKKVHLFHVLFLVTFSFSESRSQESSSSYCGKFTLQEPLINENSSYSPLLKQMVVCKSQKLYFRTSLGLFQISSIDYANKLLTVSQDSCSSTSHFVSPHHLSAGLPNPPQHNSLLLFNCLDDENALLPFMQDCTTQSPSCGVSAKGSFSCLIVEDASKLEKDFHPKRYNCSHYRRVYKISSDDTSRVADYQFGTRISFDIPDHVPDPCDECKKPDGNCGVGLKCICHLKECKDKVVSAGIILKPQGSILFSLLCLIFWGLLHQMFLK